jgi:hypothetical protein
MVGEDVAELVLLVFTAAPFGMSNWFKTWNAPRMASFPVFDGRTDWLNATSRTKRDTGLARPGKSDIVFFTTACPR